MELILVDRKADGTITITTQGFTGEACLAAVKDLKSKLGGAVVSEVPTAEALSTATNVGEGQRQA